MLFQFCLASWTRNTDTVSIYIKSVYKTETFAVQRLGPGSSSHCTLVQWLVLVLLHAGGAVLVITGLTTLSSRTNLLEGGGTLDTPGVSQGNRHWRWVMHEMHLLRFPGKSATQHLFNNIKPHFGVSVSSCWLRCHLDSSHWRLVGSLGVDPQLYGEIIHLVWLGSISGSPRMGCKT